jgi:molybdate transport system permease protein
MFHPKASSWFHLCALAAVLAFAAGIAVLFIADAAYLVEFLARSSQPERSQFGQEVFTADTMGELVLSVVTATITTVLALIIAVPAGYALSRLRIPGKVVVDTLVDAAIVLPPLILGVSLLVAFCLLRRLAEGAGSVTQPQPILQWFYDFFVYQRPGIILAQFFVAAALCIRSMRAAFDAADRRIEDVALTLGCTPFQAFWHAALPQARGGMLSGAVMAWSYAIGLFAPVAIFAGTVRGRTAVLPTRTFLEVSVGHLEIALVLTLIMSAIAGILLILVKILLDRSSRQSGSFGGLR